MLSSSYLYLLDIHRRKLYEPLQNIIPINPRNLQNNFFLTMYSALYHEDTQY